MHFGDSLATEVDVQFFKKGYSYLSQGWGISWLSLRLFHVEGDLEWALRETAAFGNRGNDKTGELIHRPLRSKLVSFANFEMFTDQG